MPDLARSTSEMLEEMKKIVQQPEGNTSCAKHRQNVASAITTLIKEQITDAPFRQLYIADAGGKNIHIRIDISDFGDSWRFGGITGNLTIMYLLRALHLVVRIYRAY